TDRGGARQQGRGSAEEELGEGLDPPLLDLVDGPATLARRDVERLDRAHHRVDVERSVQRDTVTQHVARPGREHPASARVTACPPLLLRRRESGLVAPSLAREAQAIPAAL